MFTSFVVDSLQYCPPVHVCVSWHVVSCWCVLVPKPEGLSVCTVVSCCRWSQDRTCFRCVLLSLVWCVGPRTSFRSVLLFLDGVGPMTGFRHVLLCLVGVDPKTGFGMYFCVLLVCWSHGRLWCVLLCVVGVVPKSGPAFRCVVVSWCLFQDWLSACTVVSS